MISLTRLPTITNVEESWNQMKDTIQKAASATLGITNQDTWFWNDDVEMKVREKKRLRHKFLDDKIPANWQTYKNANREAKKAVVITRANHYKDLYDKLDTRDNETHLYRLAKSRNERTQDIEHFCCVNDKNKMLAYQQNEYFEQISTEEFAHPSLPQSLPTFGPVSPVSATEVKEAIKTKNE